MESPIPNPPVIAELDETKGTMDSQVPPKDAVVVRIDENETKGPSERTGSTPVPELAIIDASSMEEWGGMFKRPSKRTGSLWTGTALIITAVIGSGVLSLPWAFAQLGWVAGPALVLIFALVTWYTGSLIANCYRFGDDLATTVEPDHSYVDAVRAALSDVWAKICVFLLRAHIFVVTNEHINAASTIMRTTIRWASIPATTKTSSTPYMIVFCVAEIFLAQIVPDYEQMPRLSIVAAVMSFIFSTIAIGLGIVQIVASGTVQGSLTGIGGGGVLTRMQALGHIAFPFAYAHILFEMEPTLPSLEASKVMRRANMFGSAVTAVLSLLCGAVGYATMGDSAHSNLLAGLGTHYAGSSSSTCWLLDVAGAAAVVHLAIAYLLCLQPLFAVVEQLAQGRSWPWPLSEAVNVPLYYVYGCGWRTYKLGVFRLTSRTVLVVATMAVSAVVPSSVLKDVVGFLGALVFWPLAVYFPVELYAGRKRVSRWSMRWVGLRLLSFACLLVTIAAGISFLAGIIASH